MEAVLTPQYRQSVAQRQGLFGASESAQRRSSRKRKRWAGAGLQKGVQQKDRPLGGASPHRGS